MSWSLASSLARFGFVVGESTPRSITPIDYAGLREEFEMDSRLRKIESKLSMLQQNTNFFIEMLHNQKR